MKRYAAALVLAIGTAGLSAERGSPGKSTGLEVAEVAVSAANYAADETGAIWAANRPRVENPTTRELRPVSPPQRYVFVAGEAYHADRKIGEIYSALEVALAKKGFLNAADTEGRIVHPGAIDLVLRVSYGDRTWRVPAVRTRDLSWSSGLATTRSSAFMAGSSVMWDRRAGGNDDGWSQVIRRLNTDGGRSHDADPSSTVAAIADARRDGATRWHHLLVVDAFSLDDLQKKGTRAKRRWSTFIAVPQHAEESFGDVMATMIRVATPYFGETTDGTQVFNDARATIDLGTPKVIESDVQSRPD